MKSHMKGAALIFSRSARLKKREAFRPFTSARASSDTDTVEMTEQNPGMSLEDKCGKFSTVFCKIL